MAAVLLATTALVSPALAQDPEAEPGLWGAAIDLEAAIGSDRQRGEADLFWPVWQDDRSMVFADIRGKVFDDSALEGNFGLGYRRMTEDGWNIGAYGFFDVRQSEHDNSFTQATVGAEALSLDWDFRVNGYIPLDDPKPVASLSGIELQGASLVMTAGAEVPLEGFDAEIGWRVPLFEVEEDQQLRVYAGGFHFESGDIAEVVEGPRLRLEYRIDDLEWLGEGSRLTVSASGQKDDIRDTQGTFGLRLRIPLQSFGEEVGGAGRRLLTPIERRMVDPVVRDVDIVTVAGVFGGPEAVVDAATNRTIGNVVIVDGTGDLATALTNAGIDGMVIAQGDAGIIPGNTAIMLTGQTLLGGGSSIQLAGATSGTTGTYTAPGSQPTVSHTGASAVVTIGGNDTNIVGLDFTGAGTATAGNYGISVGASLSNITLTGNTARNTGDYGIQFGGDVSAVTMSGNRVENTTTGGIVFGMNASGIILDNNQIIENSPPGTNWGINFSSNAADVTLTGNTITNAGIAVIFSPGAGVAGDITLSGNNIDSVGQYAVGFGATSGTVVIDSNTISGTVGISTFLLNGGSYSGSGNVDGTSSGGFCAENGLVADYTGSGFAGTGGGFAGGSVCGDGP